MSKRELKAVYRQQLMAEVSAAYALMNPQRLPFRYVWGEATAIALAESQRLRQMG